MATGDDFQRRGRLYRFLEVPALFELARGILAPGAASALSRIVGTIAATMPPAGRCLDLGCGPHSWLGDHGLAPVGLDISAAYAAAHRASGAPAVVASAARLPFAAGSFDSVWSIGLYHHLPDGPMRASLAEAVRVCRPGGFVAIVDAVLPEPPLHRPLAYALRKIDRGRFIRRAGDLASLLPDQCDWRLTRETISPVGIEVVSCVAELRGPG